MKLHTLLALSLAALAVATSTTTAKDFEGRLEMTMTGGKRTTPMTYFIKPGHLRFEMQADAKNTTAGLIDAAKGEMIILMPQQKMYMVISTKNVAAAAADVTIEPTGRTETIAGKKCEEFLVKDRKTTTEVWATTELGNAANLAEAFGRRGKRSAWEEEMVRRGMFALRVISKNARGAEISRMECTKVTEEKLDDALFTIPDDYSKLPGLGDMFGR